MSMPDDHPWEEDLAALLEDLSQVQDELLDVLARKRQCMAAGDTRGMTELQPPSRRWASACRQCHDRRAALLAEAAEQGLPGDSLGDLANALKQQGGGDLCRDVKQTPHACGCCNTRA